MSNYGVPENDGEQKETPIASVASPFEFLTGESEDVIREVHDIIKEPGPYFKKQQWFEKHLRKKTGAFQAWMKKYGCEGLKENVKELNSAKDCWNPELLYKLLETMTMMRSEHVDRFLDFCKTWTSDEKVWPGDYVMHVAKKKLEEFEKTPVEQGKTDSPVLAGEKDWTIVDRQNAENEQRMNQSPVEEQGVVDVHNPAKRPVVTDIPSADGVELPREEKFNQAVGPEMEQVTTTTEPTAPVEEPINKEENTLHIVLVGESGTGKTTTINGIANIFKYRSFDDAMESGPRVCIPTQFTTFVGRKGNKHTVIQPHLTDSTGPENNENLNGNCGSVTKDPTTHTFKYKSDGTVVTVHLTDTPGMNDTDGVEQDEKNIAKIIAHLESLPFIDAICLVLKPNEGRLSLNLTSMLRKLLSNLPKEHYGNIVICFTYGTKPGESLVLLRKNYKNLNTEADNIFCYDNEPYRYLCLLQQHPREEDNRRTDQCSEIFEHNEKELKRMLKRIESLKPFKINPKPLPAEGNGSRTSVVSPFSSLVPPSTGSEQQESNTPSSSNTTRPTITDKITSSPPTTTVFGNYPDLPETPNYHERQASSSGNAERQQRDNVFLHENDVKEILQNLVNPLAVAITRGITEKKDILNFLEARQNGIQDLRRKLSQFIYYCRCCNGQVCNFRCDGMNICGDCSHHAEHHYCHQMGGIQKEYEYRERIMQINEEIRLMSEVLSNTEKEEEIIIRACLDFCFYWSVDPTYWAPRRYPYFDRLQEAMNSIYDEKLRNQGYAKAAPLYNGKQDFCRDITNKLENLNKTSYYVGITIAEQAIRTLANLEIYKDLSNTVSSLLSRNR